jgi:Trk K+ transport system NAD-binding subunit
VQMLAGERHYVPTGLSRLTVRIADLLRARGATVTVVADEGDQDLEERLAPGVRLVRGSASAAHRLHEAGVEGSDCLLALSEDDLENLRVVAAAHEVAPTVPVVLRAFDARLVEQFQFRGNVRRCYSSSALAAPAFAAAVFGQDVLETLRLAEDEVPLCALTLREGSPLLGLTVGQMKAHWACAAVARAPRGGSWEPARGDGDVLTSGDRILVGGLLLDVLRLAMGNSTIVSRQRGWRELRRLPRLARQEPATTLVAVAGLALAALLLMTGIVFALALDLSPIDAMYRALTNAFGDVGLESASDWVKVFGVAVMVTGAVLVGVVLAHVTALFTANRLEQQASRRARRMQGHVVIAGLGMVGFRTDRLLTELDVASVIIEQRADLSRFREAASFHSPVLSGDARLAENLERAGVRDAACFVACTDDDLVNVSACAEAKHLNPSIRTVVRIFDDDLAERLDAFGIDTALSMSSAAASAFVGAATDERAARVLAVRPRSSQPLPPTAALHDLAVGTEIVVAGPEPILEECLGVSIADR